MEWNDVSISLTKKLSKSDKKNGGIFFTPPQCVERNLELLEPYLKEGISIIKVLEPSVGSGEFIDGLLRKWGKDKKMKISGVELNGIIYDKIKGKWKNVEIVKQDFLQYGVSGSGVEEKFDLIIGNPPFYVMKKGAVDKKFYPFFEGRPNIFILFLVKAFDLVEEGGIISFVLPKNFLNCLYYDKTRVYIAKHFKILEIVECDGSGEYMDTVQETVILIIQKTQKVEKKVGNLAYSLTIDDGKWRIFGTVDKIKKLRELYRESTTLRKMGFVVNGGTVVWNQCKADLTNESGNEDGEISRLIYSSDIKNHKLGMTKYNNLDKKNYIKKKGIREVMLVVNRGYGVGKYDFQYCLIDVDFEYLIENHLICIRWVGEKPIEYKKLVEMYKQIEMSFEDQRTKEFVEHYFGNNAINTTELNAILPIY